MPSVTIRPTLGALGIIFGGQFSRRTVEAGAAAGHRGHDQTVWQSVAADADRGEQSDSLGLHSLESLVHHSNLRINPARIEISLSIYGAIT